MLNLDRRNCLDVLQLFENILSTNQRQSKLKTYSIRSKYSSVFALFMLGFSSKWSLYVGAYHSMKLL